MTWRYMPILKWKRGEQYALRHLTAAQWGGVVPILELQAIDAAPDMQSIRDAMPEYSEKLVKSIGDSVAQDGQIFFDTRYVSPSAPRQLGILLVLCRIVKEKLKRPVYPVIPLHAIPEIDVLTPQQKAMLIGHNLVGLRLRTDQYEPQQTKDLVQRLVDKGVPLGRIHLVVDQFSLTGRKADDSYSHVRPYLDAAFAEQCASVTIAGGSFPIDLTGIPTGTKDLPRVEWLIWKRLLTSGMYPTLRYADYTVTNPAPQADLDPRTLNPAIAVRYAMADRWRVFKGRGFKSGAVGEYKALCELVSLEPGYPGPGFSYGDAEIQKAASGPGLKNGSPWTWRREATNRHIVLTRDLL